MFNVIVKRCVSAEAIFYMCVGDCFVAKTAPRKQWCHCEALLFRRSNPLNVNWRLLRRKNRSSQWQWSVWMWHCEAVYFRRSNLLHVY